MPKFFVLTDTHYYPPESGTSGSAYERFDSGHQVLLAKSGAVLESCFEKIAADERADTVLISGDLTSNGELTAHKKVIAMLEKLKASGKRVYVITATHDYRGEGFTDAYDGDEIVKTPTAKREDLFEMYRAFGPDEAIAVHRQSMSYVAQLDGGYRLFALNDDSNLGGKSGFSDECFSWIEEQAAKAKADGQRIVAMTHHPLIAPSPVYALIGKGDMLGDHDLRIRQLADLGVSFIFTGHTHIHDISRYDSESGSVLFDIACGSPIGAPGVYRFVSVDGGVCEVDTEFSPTPPDFDRDISEVLEDQLVGLIRDIIRSGATDIDKLAYLVRGMSIKPSLVYRFAFIIKPLFKLLNSLKIGTCAKWVKKETGLKKSDVEPIAKRKVVDLITEMFMNLYCGKSSYPPETPTYKVTMGVISVLDSLLRALRIDIGKALKVAPDLAGLVEPLLYNSGIDAYKATLDPSAPKDDRPRESTVRRSKKGLPIIIVTALLLILLLPLWLTALLVAFLVNQIRYGKKMKG